MPQGCTYTVDDVAAAILARTGQIRAVKFQKLAFYAQAAHLVAHHAPLFDDRIEAWAQGPVVRSLYRTHRREYSVSDWPAGDPDRLSPEAIASIEQTVARYGHLTAENLSELSHRELPWRAARGGLPNGARSETVIPTQIIEAFYSRHGGMTDHAIRNVVANAELEGVTPSAEAQQLAGDVLAGRSADEAVASLIAHLAR